jgi:hypothetical protein
MNKAENEAMEIGCEISEQFKVLKLLRPLPGVLANASKRILTASQTSNSWSSNRARDELSHDRQIPSDATRYRYISNEQSVSAS